MRVTVSSVATTDQGLCLISGTLCSWGADLGGAWWVDALPGSAEQRILLAGLDRGAGIRGVTMYKALGAWVASCD